jgi:alpha-tubulin suppressor-like RCC1 family protein
MYTKYYPLIASALFICCVANAQTGSGELILSTGADHSLVLNVKGELWGMGNNSYNRMSNNAGFSGAVNSTPKRITNDVTAIAAGSIYTLYVRKDGTMWGAGYNQNGTLGSAIPYVQTNLFTQVDSGVVDVKVGANHALFIKSDGSLWAQGDNNMGQLGNGTTGSITRAFKVTDNVTAIAAGDGHSMFVKKDGTLWAAGAIGSGAPLGNGTSTGSSTPIQISTNVVSIAAGFRHSLFVKSDGSLWATGLNNYGQLGDGSLTTARSPKQIATNVRAVFSSYNHALFVKNDDTLWGMGQNEFSQLGDGSITNRLTPVLIDTDVKTASAGKYHSLYSKKNGSVWAMGTNSSGQLGDGTQIERNKPIELAPPAISAAPVTQTIKSGSGLSLSVTASGSNSPTYQWYKDGVLLSGQTTSKLTISTTNTSSAGSYTVEITNWLGSTTSKPVAVAVQAPRLYSLAVRTALEANQVLIVGFTMSGGAKDVLLRAAGPTLGAFGVPETMADPKLELYTGSTLITSNDNWGGSSSLAATFQSAGAFAYASTTSLDAALVASINGGRTAHVYGPIAGAVLVEGYDVGSGDAQKFTSLSARNRVGTGANILIAGFSLSGEGNRNLLIRAVGPTLSVFGVPNVLSDPKLEIYQGSTKIGENDNWSSTLSTTFSSVGAFGLTQGSKDAAITVSLPAGGYTVQVSGVAAGVGEALVEIYELP